MFVITSTRHSIEGNVFGANGAKMTYSVHKNGSYFLHATGIGVGGEDNVANFPDRLVKKTVAEWELESPLWLLSSIPNLLRFFAGVIEDPEVKGLLGAENYQSLKDAIVDNGYFPV